MAAQKRLLGFLKRLLQSCVPMRRGVREFCLKGGGGKRPSGEIKNLPRKWGGKTGCVTRQIGREENTLWG